MVVRARLAAGQPVSVGPLPGDVLYRCGVELAVGGRLGDAETCFQRLGKHSTHCAQLAAMAAAERREDAAAANYDLSLPGLLGELCRGSWAITGFEAATDLSGNVCSYPLIELAPR